MTLDTATCKRIMLQRRFAEVPILGLEALSVIRLVILSTRSGCKSMDSPRSGLEGMKMGNLLKGVLHTKAPRRDELWNVFTEEEINSYPAKA
jgi:hypothetical protein